MPLPGFTERLCYLDALPGLSLAVRVQTLTSLLHEDSEKSGNSHAFRLDCLTVAAEALQERDASATTRLLQKTAEVPASTQIGLARCSNVAAWHRGGSAPRRADVSHDEREKCGR